MMKTIFTIFWKDFLETLHDRRAVMRMILMPCLIVPMMGHLFVTFTQKNSEKLDTTTLNYAIIGESNLPDLAKLYAADPGFRRVDVAESGLAEAIKNKAIRFALVIPADAKQNLSSGARVDIKFMYYQSAPGQAVVKERGTAPLKAYSEKQRDWRLAFRGVSDESARSNLLNPVSFDVDNVASAREQVGHGLGTLLAYPLVIICFVGCTFSAANLVTGEKVKGTLEILIMLPISRTAIVIAKYLVVLVIGLLYSTFCLGSFMAWLFLEGTNSSTALASMWPQIRLLDILLVWLMLVPVNALFAAVLLAISVYAKSYREASGLSGVLNVVAMLAVTSIFSPGVDLTWRWSTIPVANAGLAVRELIKGTVSNYLMLGYMIATTFVLAGIALSLSIRFFRKESVIFRD
jgi:sodium transport system permease protein